MAIFDLQSTQNKSALWHTIQRSILYIFPLIKIVVSDIF